MHLQETVEEIAMDPFPLDAGRPAVTDGTVFPRRQEAMTMKRLTRALILLPILTMFASAGAVRAQTDQLPDPGMLPDSPFYFLKSMGEGVGTFFTFGDVNDAERALELSERRLAEARALAEQGKPDEAEKAAERYRDQLERALAKAEKARENGKDTDEILARTSEATLRHQAVLADVHAKVPEQARPGIERAMQASRRGHEQSQRAISRQKREDVERDERRTPGRPETGRPGGSDRPGADRPGDSDRPGADRPEAPDRPEEEGRGASDRPGKG